jgi:hypothetical protein
LIAAVFRKICEKQGFLKVFGASELLERVSELLEREFEEPVRAAEEPGVASERFRWATTGSRFTAKEFSASWRGGTVAKNLSKILMGKPARVELSEGAKSSGYYRPAENLFASINTATFSAMIFSHRAAHSNSGGKSLAPCSTRAISIPFSSGR